MYKYVDEKDVASAKKIAWFVAVSLFIVGGYLCTQDEFQTRSSNFVRGDAGYYIIILWLFFLGLVCVWLGTFGTKKKTD